MRTRILKDNLVLSKLQKEILVGLLLGDGCLESTKNSQVARLKVDQSLKQAEFVEWLYEVFKDFVHTPPRLKQIFRSDKRYSELVFNTLTHKSFKHFYNLFYPKGKKLVPESIYKILSSKGLAVWFMSDGSVKSKECLGRILNTQSFTRPDIERVLTVLRDKFNLNVSIRTQKDGLQIYISAKSAEVLNKLLKDKILPFFQYKLPIRSLR